MHESDYDLLPNFLLIGAAKAGTTTLHNVLNQHPEIFCTKIKEPNFFSSDERFQLGLDWYQRKYFSQARGFPARGESSATTLYWGKFSAPRIKSTFSGRRVKFLAIFRDPVMRAYSHYWQQVRNGFETLSFEDALLLEEDRLQVHEGEMQKKGKNHFGYFRGGCYASLLQPFLEQFRRDDFVFILLEDLGKNFLQTMINLEMFLGVKSGFHFQPVQSNSSSSYRIPELDRLMRKSPGNERSKFWFILRILPDPVRKEIKRSIRNANTRSYTYQPMKAETANLLRERYQVEIEQLESILKRPLDPWKTSPEIT